MPIHEFCCDKCGHEFEEIILPNQEEKAVCPECGSSETQKLLSAGSVRPNGIPSGGGGWSIPPCKLNKGGDGA